MADGHIHERGTGASVKRRGILAAAGAAVAVAVAKQASQPVAADGAVQAPGTNTASDITTLQYTGGVLTTVNAVTIADGTVTSSTFPAALRAYAEGGKVRHGVFGYTNQFTGNGVVGRYDGASGGFSAGVRGIGATNTNGVYGTCNGRGSTGVRGVVSDAGVGVHGSTSDSDGTGVVGISGTIVPGNGIGVYGRVDHVGSTVVTAGVFGDSEASYGVLGRTTAANYSGCTGIADGVNRAAFAGAGTGGAYAAYFTGPTVVQGNFTVVGGAKNAAVKHPDGTHRLLHCVESPEPWFEDFGKAKLVNGHAEVKLDADFAAVTDAADYHVFLTPYGTLGALRVASVRPDGFAVEEIGGAASGAFSWRVVARRKDIKAGRLAKFDLPKIRLPKPEEMPPPPAPPKK